MGNSNPIYFPKTSRLKEEITEIGAKAAKELYDAKDLVSYLNEVFRKEYTEYLSKSEFFPGCPFILYEKHYESRLQNYSKIYPDADEFDFLKEEDALFWSLSRMDVESKHNFYSFYPHLYSKPHRFNIELSIHKMHSFIDKKIIDLGHYFKGPEGVDPVDYSSYPRNYFEPERNPEASSISAGKSQNNFKSIDPVVPELSLKALFQDENLYTIMLDKLLEHHLISSTSDGKWKLSTTAFCSGSGLTEERIMAALGFVLFERNYFKGGVKAVDIARGLNSFFTTELKDKTYNRSHKEFLKIKEGPEIRNSKVYEYLSIFHMIKPQHSRFINSKQI